MPKLLGDVESTPWAARSPAGPPARGLTLATLAAVLGVAYGSLLPFDFHRIPDASSAFGFLDIRVHATTPDDARTNIAVYMPIGLLLAWSVGRRGRPAVLLGAFGAAWLSIALESLQTCVRSRVGSWTDVALNVAGALIGAALARSLGRLMAAAVSQGRRELRTRPMRLAASLLTLGLFLYGLMPFDFVTTTAELHASFTRATWGLPSPARIAMPLSMSAGVTAITGALWFALLGYLLALAGFEGKRSLPAVLGSSMKHGALLAALIEGLQLFTLSHVFDLGTVFLRLISVLLGAWSAASLTEERLERSGDARHVTPTSVLGFVCIMQLALLLAPAIAWQPGASGRSYLPFELFWRSSLPNSVSEVLSIFMTYGVFAWTLAVLARRLNLSASVVPVGVATVSLGLPIMAVLLGPGDVDPATPVLAALAAWAAYRLDRALKNLPEILPRPF